MNQRLREEASEYSSNVVCLTFFSEIPVDCLDLVTLHVVNTKGVFRFVTSYQYLVVSKVNSLASDVGSEDLLDGCLNADVPKVHSPVPSSTQQHIGVIGIPF